MPIKMFTGEADEVQKESNKWQAEFDPVIEKMVQSESAGDGFWGVTLTFLYELRGNGNIS